MILRRLPDSRFSEVLPAWKGSTAVLLGGGASLTREQVSAVRAAAGVRVVAINDAYLWCDWADVLYAADEHWHAWHAAGIAKPGLDMTIEEVRDRYASFAGEKCSIQAAKMAKEPVHIVRNKHFPNLGHGLSLNPQELVTGWNGGFQSLNLAILAGAKKVILLGFDGKPSDAGKSHFHGGHMRVTPMRAYEEYRRAFSAAETEITSAGVEVLNCSPGSAIDSFPKVALAEALK